MNAHEKITLDRELYGYQLTELLAQNSFGAHYQGLEMATKRPVYVLVFNSLVGNDPVLSERIVELAEAMKALKHPSILQVLECIRGSQGCIWVEEYVNGTTLDKYLEQKGPLEWQQALRYLRQILSGLDIAHTRHILHEALHPGNVLISRGNTAKLMQFGLASIVRSHSFLLLANQDADPYNLYKAPEIKNNSEIASRASDIYSTGLIAYEMITKRRPGDETSSPFSTQRTTAFPEITPPHEIRSSVPIFLSDTIMHALERHSVHRFQRAGQMLEAISTLKTDVATPNVIYHREAYFKNLLKSFASRKFLVAIAILTAFLLALLIHKMNAKNPFQALASAIHDTAYRNRSVTAPAASNAVADPKFLSSPVVAGNIDTTSVHSGDLESRRRPRRPIEVHVASG